MASVVALLLSLDQTCSVWLREPQLTAIPVTRTVCTRVSRFAVSIDSEQDNGQWCFLNGSSDSLMPSRWRVDIKQVRRPLARNESGTLKIRIYPSVMLGEVTYVILQNVE